MNKSIGFEMHLGGDGLVNFNPPRRTPPDRDLTEAFRILSRFSIVQKLCGNWQDPDCRFLVLPSIHLVLPNDAITRIYQSLQSASVGVEADGQSDGMGGSGGPGGSGGSGGSGAGADQLELDGLEPDAALDEEDTL